MSALSGMGAMRAIGAVPFEATINSKSRGPAPGTASPALGSCSTMSLAPQSPLLQEALEICLGWKGGILGTVVVH